MEQDLTFHLDTVHIQSNIFPTAGIYPSKLAGYATYIDHKGFQFRVTIPESLIIEFENALDALAYTELKERFGK